MASTSSTPGEIRYKYDIFLSFRGDTRHAFTDHLYKALLQAGIRTFRDDDEIQAGQGLKPVIESSITQSRASIIVFSETFAESRWCLEEVALILQQTRLGNHFVLAVFYKVDPSDVRNQRGSFKIEAKEGSKWTVDNVDRWKEALTEVANLKGMVVSGYETSFIPNIVDKVYRELGLKLRNVPTGLTGIETRAEVINSWLNTEQAGSPVLAICGMGGGGKTTLAKYVYYSNKQNFDSSSLLEEVEKQPDGWLGVQNKLLRDISGNSNLAVSNVYEGAFQIEMVLQMNRVLVVVDDIDDIDQLTTLFGTKVFPTKSKIIITTRLLNIDTWFESISSGCQIYKIKLLNHHESLELLCRHAFGSKIPMEGFEELAGQVVRYCEGNPLALKVLGSSLAVRAQDQWTRSNMIETWRSRMSSLNSMKGGDLDRKIQGVLRKSFESLPCDSHKELFLHIAFFFVRQHAPEMERILENDWYAKSGVVTLVNRCLVTISKDSETLTMHKLLQDMARKIVDEESKEPATRSRIWRHDESYRLLSKGDGSEKIQGLLLDMRGVEQAMTSQTLKTSSLVKMKNLKLLHLVGVKLTGSYQNFPELILLRWWGWNLKTVPLGLLTSSLVAIDMSFGDLEKFEPPMVLNSLKILRLTCCYKLVCILSLDRLPKLETLNLAGCTSLTNVCKTIGDLANVFFLNLSGCTKLWTASSNQTFVNQLERFKALFIGGGLPEQPLFSLPQSLSGLSLRNSPFELMPNYVKLEMLLRLDLAGSPNLKSLPCLPSKLEELHVDWCSSLENITFQSARFKLRVFSYEGCFKLCEIQGLFKLVPIENLDEADLGHMQWIKVYQDHKVDLVGDLITKGRTFNIQMLYEYGIKSTYLQGIKDQSMAKHDYTSSSDFISFHVPSHPKKHRIQGLNVTILYKSSGGEDRHMRPSFIKLNNRSKGVTWVYNPVVFCKPTVDNDVVWLSYWPIGNVVEVGDEILLGFFLGETTMTATGFGVSVVYTDDDEVGKEETCEMTKGEEVIGGDLSEFEVTDGGYYLCRHDFFKSKTSVWLKSLFGNKIYPTDSRRWRASRPSEPALQKLNFFRNHERIRIKVELGMNLRSESESRRIEKEICSIVGVESVVAHKEVGRLSVVGRVDPQDVAKCARQFQTMVQVIDFKHL